MPRLLVAVLLFVLSSPALAAVEDSADLSVQFGIPARVTAGTSYLAFAQLSNLGPDTAENVVLTTTAGYFTGSHDCVLEDGGRRCTVKRLPAGGGFAVVLWIDREPVVGVVPITVEAASTTPDPNPANNRIVGQVEFVLAPWLRFSLYGSAADPGGTANYDVSIYNESEIAAIDANFTIPLPEGWSFERSLSPELQCVQTGSNVRCAVARIEPRTEFRGTLLLRAPNTPEGSYTEKSVPVKIDTAHGVISPDLLATAHFATTIYRTIAVTNTADSGEGSLRHAIETVNAGCTFPGAPCKITFDIDSAAPHHTIRPLKPLPSIRKYVHIDGSTQSTRHGETNPVGPEIEINGSLLTAGDGLEVTGEQAHFELRDLAINGFPGNGVSLRRNMHGASLHRNYIGTDVTGRIAVPNGGRGIVVETPDLYYANISIRDNVISGNARSGVFIGSAYQITLINNRIGVSAGDRPEPLGNGATGIFLGPRAWAVTIQKNVIAHNADAGIGTSSSGTVAIRRNAIYANGSLGIDRNLDLVSTSPALPVITAASYDPSTNVTHIEGRIASGSQPDVSEVELFANSSSSDEGYGEGELFIGYAKPLANAFTLDYRGDLRGRFITATFTFPNNYYPELPDMVTSEFGPAFRVDGEAAGPIDPASIVPRGADLGIRLGSWFRHQPGVQSQMWINIPNFGPETPDKITIDITADAGNLVPSNEACRPVETGGLRCVTRFGYPELYFYYEPPTGMDSATIAARVSSSIFDPDPSNNQTSLKLEITSPALLDLRITSPGPVDPGARATYDVYVSQRGTVAASDVEVRIPIPVTWPVIEIPSGKWNCSMVENHTLLCRTAVIEGKTTDSFSYTLRAPSHAVRHFATEGKARAAEYEFFPPTSYALYEVFNVLAVTTTADRGAGSLRDALDRATAQCGFGGYNCKVIFRIDAASAANGVFTIRPVERLPAVGAIDITIDGRTQTEHTGDTNPLGPEIELNGLQTATASGLELQSTGTVMIRSLTINGFPENGILFRTFSASKDYRDRRRVVGSYIGTDPTGRLAVPNRGRGIAIESTIESYSRLELLDNVISGNDRAGIVVNSGEIAHIARNRIGVSAGEERLPLPNGASGIYLGKSFGAIIEGNAIANNAHAGVATSPESTWTAVRANTMYDNGGLGIDHGIDSVTFNDGPDRPEDLPGFPTITSAVWDASRGVTRIEGRGKGTRFVHNAPIIELYANRTADPSGYGEGLRSLGTVTLPLAATTEQFFAFEIAEDLRGQLIAATLTVPNSFAGGDWTSEFSQNVPVQ